MKIKSLLLSLVFILLATFSEAQNYKIIARIDQDFLDKDYIDSREQGNISFHQILNLSGKNELKNLSNNFPDLENYIVKKMFPGLRTYDTLSISRQGNFVRIPPFWATFSIEIPENVDYFRILNAIKRSKLVDYAHPDFKIQLQSSPNDSLYWRQYALHNNTAGINIEGAWDIETGKPWIKVGVHDNGIDTLHPDIKVVWGAGYSGTDSPETGWGGNYGWHGTPVAGIIGAKRNNNIGVAGIAGGDGSDSSGVSLFDFRYSFNNNISENYFMAAVVDAARAVGSYWDYNGYATDTSGYFTHAPGYGIHIGNHSYTLLADIPLQDSVGPSNLNGVQDLNKIPGIGYEDVGPCLVCKESFLFSLKNGVINVVARGNSGALGSGQGTTYVAGLFPQNLPDNIIISVGASGYNGTIIENGINQGYYDALNNFYSLYGGNMDLIAPGSDSIAFSTTSTSIPNNYEWFNGTSAAAPHVTGAIALILSHYNKPCYNPGNLSIEDVEYILQKSAVDLQTAGYNEKTAWGRLNVDSALRMIKLPHFQIIHPDSLISTTVYSEDTIYIYYGQALTNFNWSPLTSGFDIAQQKIYKVIRSEVHNTYDLSNFIQQSTQIIDYWGRPSISDGLSKYVDTVWIEGPAQVIDTTADYDTLDMYPFCQVINFDSLNFKITTKGYFYKILAQYKDPLNDQPGFNVGPDYFILEEDSINLWYPLNPYSDTIRLLPSIYIKDTLLNSIYDYPCVADNPLYDENYPPPNSNSIKEKNIDDFFIHPNPFDDYINLVFNDNSKKYVELIDINGRLIMSISFYGSSYKLETNSLESGVYLINYFSNSGITSKKLIKL